MNRIRILSFIIVLCLAFSFAVPGAFALEEPRLKSADAVIVVDMATGQILYEKNKDMQHSIASLTKMMTCLLAVEAVENGRVQLTDKVQAQSDCLQGLDVSSSNAGIQPGEIMSYQDLMYCALVHSANDACNVLATYIEGSIAAFVAKMNERAQQLGCVNTHFNDTDGMLNRSEGHYSSPYDLYLIASEAMSHQLFRKICGTSDYTVAATNYRPSFEIHNSNALMTENGLYGGGYKYDGVVGIKTGFTKPAGYCLVSTCKRDDKNIMVVVLGCNGVLTYTFAGEYQNFLDSATLYDWAFNNFTYHDIFIAGERLKRYDVQYAKDGETVPLCPDETIKTLVSNEFSEKDILIDIHPYEDRLVAPIAEGDTLGYADVYIGGELFKTVNMLAGTSVEMEKSQRIKNTIHDFFSSKGFKITVFSMIALVVILTVLSLYLKQKRRSEVRARMIAAEQRRAERMQNGAVPRPAGRTQPAVQQIRRNAAIREAALRNTPAEAAQRRSGYEQKPVQRRDRQENMRGEEAEMTEVRRPRTPIQNVRREQPEPRYTPRSRDEYADDLINSLKGGGKNR